MVSAIGLNAISYFFEQASRLSFIPERFFSLGGTPSPQLPKAEILARHKDGLSAGHIFDEARRYDQIISTDLIALEIAVQKHLELGEPVSINLNAETFFSDLLMPRLDELLAKYPAFKPSGVCLEITEQGGVPASYNEQYLIALKDKGFMLGLDDFNPNDLAEYDRLTHFGPHVDIVKFPHEYMHIVRFGSDADKEKFAAQVAIVKTAYPNAMIVMEGVKESDMALIPLLQRMGIDLVQQSSHCPEGPVRALEQDAIELALKR